MRTLLNIFGALAFWLILSAAFSAVRWPAPPTGTDPPRPSPEDLREDENARLDREIKATLAAGQVYHPPETRKKLAAAEAKQPAALWTVARTTLACASLRDAEAFAFVDALGGSAGLRNPESDPSQTSCRHVQPGDRIARGRAADGGLVSVRVNDGGPTYMIDTHIVPAK